MSDLPEDRVAEVEAGSASSREGGGLDPWTKRLVIASGVLVIAVLLVTAGIVYFASRGTTVPRTAVERDFMVSKQKAQLNPKDVTAWAEYASASIVAGKLDDAASAIASLESISKSGVVPLLKGDLAAARGDISAARKDYEQAVAVAGKEHDAAVMAAQGKGIVNPQTVKPSQMQIQSYVSLGDLDMQVKDYGAAITHLQKALQLDPTAADVLVPLGDAQLAKGRAKDAVASYKAALQYIPGYGPALDGLKRAQGGR